jgi:CelD/BcsL family acetyltransferase involved in cellulose biosynthesis
MAQNLVPSTAMDFQMSAPDCPSPTTSHQRAAGTRIIAIDHKNDPRYKRFLESQSQALIFHHPGWLNALAAESKAKCLVLACENAAGDLKGILPLMYTRGLPFNIGSQQTGRRLTSLPRTPEAGPVSSNDDATAMLLRFALATASAECVRLQIKSTRNLLTDSVEGIVQTNWRPTFLLEIPERREHLQFGDARNRHNLRWGVKKAEKAGLRIRTADSEAELRAWYRVYLATMRRNVVPPRSLRFFLAMWKELASQGFMQLQLAEQVGDNQRRLVAGSVFLKFGERIWYAFTGVADRDLPLHPNDLILWNVIHEACGTGIRWMDLGEVPEEHPELVRFKTKWGAQPVQQYRFYPVGATQESITAANITAHSVELLRRCWRHLPLGTTAQLGNLIYSRL